MLPDGWEVDGYFYPRPPRGGRPVKAKCQDPSQEFLSTPSARRATAGHPKGGDTMTISIHALREEGDDPRKHRARQTI